MPRARINLVPAAEVGSTANSYEILAKIATGGMAEIFLARGASVAGVERYVVLKRVLRERASDHHFVRMFLDEARLAAQLQHPNIAQVYDIGKLGDSFFFTMEYVHGETVRALLQRSVALSRPVPLGAVLAIASGAAAGLHHAHDRNGLDGKPLGIVHRDVTPSNLMVSFEGNVKVVDFGVAKAAHRTQETRSGTVKGKISYLSPEQCRGMEIDRRSDVFSLGIVIWEMLTTERLYRRNSDFEAMDAIVNEAVTPPSARRNDIPPQLDRLVLRALAKTPDERFQTAEELLEEIDAIAAQRALPLSAPALGRFVRELFGQRPPPWVELREELHAEGVTVTSEPIPPELAMSVAHSIDRQLAHVVDLSGAHDSSKSVPPFPTVPLRKVPPDMLPTVPVVAVPQPVAAIATPRAPSAPSSVSSRASSAPSSVSSNSPPRKRAPLVIALPAVAIAGLAVVVIVIAMAQPGRSVPDAALVAAPAIAIDAATVVPDAAVVAEVVPDAAAVVATVPDAAVAVATEPGDGHPSARPRPRLRDPVKSYEAGRYIDVVTECTANAAALEAATVPCVLAACHVHDVVKARKWFATLPASKRARVIDTCDLLRVELEPPAPVKAKPPEHDCLADPMACQR